MIELVTRAEITRRLKVSRQRVGSWTKSSGNGFPPPHARVGDSLVWEWSAVARWATTQHLNGSAPHRLSLETDDPPESVLRPLPLPPDTFVGRDRELELIAKLLDEPGLITVTGPAGIGKTRLAVEAGARVLGNYPDGVFFVPLAPIDDATDVPRAVAQVLSLRPPPGRPADEALMAHLGQRRLLMILDNCEHVAPACSALAGALIEACPALTILATSREALGTHIERCLPVPPLAVHTQAGIDGGLDPGSSEAVQLFFDRGGPALGPTTETVTAAADLCRQLDGIPLAIELAAAWVNVLSPTEIAARLGDRFKLLTLETVSDLSHHRTLREAVDWSYQLLDEGARSLLRRLSVFAGSCSVVAIEAVCNDDDLAGQDLLNALATLVAKSLVVADTRGPESRYWLLETIRRYGAERLSEQGETSVICQRHREWFLAFVQQCEPQLTGPDQVEWFERVEAQHDNLRAALASAVEQGCGTDALALSGGLGVFWRIRGPWAEGCQWLSTALSCGQHGPPELRAKALWALGFLSLMRDDRDAALAALVESQRLARSCADVEGQARAALILGNHWGMADRAKGLKLLRQATELARQCNDGWCLSHALGMLGRLHLDAGDANTARPLLEECLEVARATGDLQGFRLGAIVLGELLVAQGDGDLAKMLLFEGLAAARRLGEGYAISSALGRLGELEASHGHYDQARDLLGSALVIDSQQNLGLSNNWLCGLGRVSQAEGDTVTARRRFLEADRVARAGGRVSGRALVGLGEMAIAEGNHSKGRGLLEEALASARSHEAPVIRADAAFGLACLAQHTGDFQQASALHHEVLAIRHRAGRLSGVLDSLEALGGLLGNLGEFDRAARLLGAAEAVRQANGLVRPPVAQASYEANVTVVRDGLGRNRFKTAWAEGAALSVDEAVSYASKARGRRAHNRPPTGWTSLTKAELSVVGLVAEGLPSAEIAKRLFLSVRTVESHLYAIYVKLGISSRTELVREAFVRGNPASLPNGSGPNQ